MPDVQREDERRKSGVVMSLIPKTILLLGACLVVLFSVYMPYTGVYLKEGDNLKVNIGYWCIFSPPRIIDVIYGFNLPSDEQYNVIRKNRYFAEPNINQAMLTVAGSIAATVMLYFAAAKKES